MHRGTITSASPELSSRNPVNGNHHSSSSSTNLTGDSRTRYVHSGTVFGRCPPNHDRFDLQPHSVNLLASCYVLLPRRVHRLVCVLALTIDFICLLHPLPTDFHYPPAFFSVLTSRFFFLRLPPVSSFNPLPPCLFFIYLQQPITFQFSGPMRPFLLALRAQVIPASLIPFLYDIRPPISFVDGCLVVEIQDFRKSPDPIRSRVVMRPAAEALAQTIDVMLERRRDGGDEEMALELESRIIVGLISLIFSSTTRARLYS